MLPYRISMVISSLSGGGAERVLALLSRAFTEMGHKVSVVTIFGEEEDFYPLPEGVGRVALGLGKTTVGMMEKIAANRARISALGRALRETRPDVVISFMTETNVLTLLATLRMKIPVIVTEHADPRKKCTPRAWKTLRRLSYRFASRVVSVSEGVDEYFAWLPKGKRAVIPNPVDLSAIRSAAGDPLELPWPRALSAMGRLEIEKGFDVLVRAFARVADDFPDWGLVILGEGTKRPSLESWIAELDMAGRAQLPGLLEDPFPTLKRSDVFVLSSRTESFGLALVEAMACSLPVIATECWHASPGIVRQGVDGILVPGEDVEALAGAMTDLMGDEEKRRRLASEAVESVRRFDLGAVIQRWDELLKAVVKSATH
jgi:glycosyltransferase involved in cell wall biosynthesis